MWTPRRASPAWIGVARSRSPRSSAAASASAGPPRSSSGALARLRRDDGEVRPGRDVRSPRAHLGRAGHAARAARQLGRRIAARAVDRHGHGPSRGGRPQLEVDVRARSGTVMAATTFWPRGSGCRRCTTSRYVSSHPTVDIATVPAPGLRDGVAAPASPTGTTHGCSSTRPLQLSSIPLAQTSACKLETSGSRSLQSLPGGHARSGSPSPSRSRAASTGRDLRRLHARGGLARVAVVAGDDRAGLAPVARDALLLPVAVHAVLALGAVRDVEAAPQGRVARVVCARDPVVALPVVHARAAEVRARVVARVPGVRDVGRRAVVRARVRVVQYDALGHVARAPGHATAEGEARRAPRGPRGRRARARTPGRIALSAWLATRRDAGPCGRAGDVVTRVA